MEIQDLLRVIWRRKWLTLSMGVFGGVIALFILQNKKDDYKSQAKISTGYTATDHVGLVDNLNSLRDADVKFSNLLELMNSPITFNLLSYRLLLHDLDTSRPVFNRPHDVSILYKEGVMERLGEWIGGMKKSMLQGGATYTVYDLHTAADVTKIKEILRSRLENLTPLAPDDPDFEFIRKFLLEFGYSYQPLRESLTISRLPNTDFILVEYVSKNSSLSAFAANVFCEEFIRYYNTLRGEYSAETVEFLEEVANEKKKDLDTKLETLRRFKSPDNLLNAEDGSATRMDQLVSLEEQRDESKSRLGELDLIIKRLKGDLDQANQPSANNRDIMEIQDQLQSLQVRYTASNHQDKEISDSIAYLRGKLRLMITSNQNSGAPRVSGSEIEGKIKDAEIEHEVESNKLSLIVSKIDALKFGFSTRESKEIKIAAIQHEIDLATKEYLEVANKYNDALNLMVSVNTLRKVQSAMPSLTPDSIGKELIAGLAAFASLAITLFVLILMEILDSSIRTPSGFRRMVGMPLIGVVNMLDGKKLNIQEVFSEDTRKEKTEMFKSSIRKLRHQVESKDGRVVMFTSLSQGTGKTFLIFSLAYALSLLHKRVLVVDTNFKSNALTRIYGVGMEEIKVIKKKMISAKPLLAELMENGTSAGGEPILEEEVETAAVDLVNSSQFENVFFVGNTGISSGTLAELLPFKEIQSFISTLSDQFDYILLEGPALNEFPDTRELITFTDKVVVVFSAESRLGSMDRQSLDYLESLGNKVSGAVLNKVNPEDMNL